MVNTPVENLTSAYVLDTNQSRGDHDYCGSFSIPYKYKYPIEIKDVYFTNIISVL
jgi:hypothetical protein